MYQLNKHLHFETMSPHFHDSIQYSWLLPSHFHSLHFFFFFFTDARLCADPQTEPETEATGKVQNRWHSYRKEGNSSAKLLLIQQMQIYVPQVCGSVLRAVLVTQT